jgi:Na+-transporting methylmalonyl-CoA/oxaloacetate decarboxylase gamma subunit
LPTREGFRFAERPPIAVLVIAIVFGSIFVLGVLALLVVAARGGGRLRTQRRTKVETARPATARISEIEETGSGRDVALGEFRRYALTLDVRDGTTRSTLRTVWNVKADAPIAAGADIDIRIDTSDDAIYPAFDGAEYEWLKVRRDEALAPADATA